MLLSGCEKNSELSAIGNKLFMVQHGWQFDFTHDGSILSDNYKNVGKKCGPQAKWYGWSAHSHVGTLSATLKGSGEVTINFGNCWDQGVVKVYLDANVVGIASVGEKSKQISVSFTPGSVLSFKDESGNAVIMLNSITFKCYGMIFKQFFEEISQLHVYYCLLYNRILTLITMLNFRIVVFSSQ